MVAFRFTEANVLFVESSCIMALAEIMDKSNVVAFRFTEANVLEVESSCIMALSVCVGLFVSTESLLATTLCLIQNIPDVFRHNSNICRWILTISRRNVSPESRQLKGGIIFNLA